MDREISKTKSRKHKRKGNMQSKEYQMHFILKVLLYIPTVYVNLVYQLLLFVARGFNLVLRQVESYSRSITGLAKLALKTDKPELSQPESGKLRKPKRKADLNVFSKLRGKIAFEFQALIQEVRDLKNLIAQAFRFVFAKFSFESKPVVKAKSSKSTLRHSINKKLKSALEAVDLAIVSFFKFILAIILWPFKFIYKILKAVFTFEIKLRLFSFRTLLIITFLAGVYLGSAFYFIVWKDLPKVQSLTAYEPRQTTTIYDRKGNVLYRLYNDEDRTLVPLTEIPEILINATIAIEDAAFFEHRGLSIKGIARAARRTFLEDGLEGGSTITQQLVKNTLLTAERTYERKAKEAVIAVEVERRYSKEQILEMYLNRISYGGTSYGVKSAAKRYFGKELNELTLSEASFLAGLPVAPSRYSPFAGNLEAGKARQKLVLERMVANNFVSLEEATMAYSEKLEFKSPTERIIAPHFVNYVIAELEEKYGQMLVMQGGLDVFTSIDMELQNQLETIVNSEVSKMKRNNVSNGAALITNPKTGEILAMVGSVNYWDTSNDGNVNITTSMRQPGSSIKPVTYSLALENGYSLGSIIEDSPVSYDLPGQPAYRPVNYDGRFHGRLTLKQALANSYNVPAVKLLENLGVSNLVEHGKNMGITTWDNSSRFGLSLTLGAGEVKMTDMAVVYGTFANQGYRKDLNPILKVYDSYGNAIEENDCVNFLDESPSILTRRALFETNAWASSTESARPTVRAPKVCEKKQVLSSSTAYLISNILTDNNARSAAFGANSELNVTQKQFAVKTGTTNSVIDNWAIGYNEDFVIVTWIGNNYNEPMRGVASGYGGSSTIWREAVDYLIENRTMSDRISMPSGLVEVDICPLTNTLACRGCPNVKQLYERGKEPTNACDPRVIEEMLRGRDDDNDFEDEDI